MGSNFFDLPYHRQGASGMSLVGKSAATGGGLQPGIRLVLTVIDTGGPAVCVLFVVAIVHDDEYGGK